MSFARDVVTVTSPSSVFAGAVSEPRKVLRVEATPAASRPSANATPVCSTVAGSAPKVRVPRNERRESATSRTGAKVDV
jgi:hypothetical protein